MIEKPKVLNYTTKIRADKTVGEIQGILASNGARAIMTEYDGFGVIAALSFRIPTAYGELTFRMPVNKAAVLVMMKQDKRVPKSLQTDEQAARVAWRIMKDWIEVQMMLIRTGQVDVVQAFLAYTQDSRGETLYAALKDKKFQGYALPAPK